MVVYLVVVPILWFYLVALLVVDMRRYPRLHSEMTVWFRSDVINSERSEFLCLLPKMKNLHRPIVESVLRRSLSTAEIIHHVDGNHWNNDKSNLMVTDAKFHAWLHRASYDLIRRKRGVVEK